MEGSVYVKARREWDERYADLVLGKRNWQIAASLMVITPVLAFPDGLGQHPKQVRSLHRGSGQGYGLDAPSAGARCSRGWLAFPPLR